MTQKVLIATTPTAGLQRLGSVGQRSYELLTGVITRQLSPDHAALFTDPVAATKGDFVDWYAEVEAPPQQLAQLSTEDRVAVEARLTSLCDDIRRFGEDMAGQGSPDAQRLGEALINATQIPGEGSVFAVAQTDPNGGTQWRPVIVDWASVDASAVSKGARQLVGWTPKRPTAAPPAPKAAAPEEPVPAAPATAPPPPPPLPKRPTAPILWPFILGLTLTAAALTFALWFLLIPACAVAGFGWLSQCPDPTAELDQAEVLTDLARNRTVLENRIALLERDLAAQDGLCLPDPETQLTPAPLPEPEEEEADARSAEDAEIDDRLAREDATEGELDITLAWNSLADLDLHVTCPAGDRINYANRISTECGGTLDVDMNVGSGGVPDPVEHVYFDAPQTGDYELMVRFYNAAFFGGDQPFTVRVRFGDETEVFTGVVTPSNPVWTQRYTYSP